MNSRPPTIVASLLAIACMFSQPGFAVEENLVQNGTFEADADGDGVPDAWSTSGVRGMEQRLTLDAGRAGGKAAKLTCTKFVEGTPSSHAMICQVGAIPIKRNQWYRLTFWAKARGLKRPVINAAVRNTQTWGDTGMRGMFVATPEWRRAELTFRSNQDIPAEHTRLQIWFTSTGELWLDDVAMTPIQLRYENHPQISAKGVRNLVPNSSFECGAAGWGSWSPNIRFWGGNVSRLMGEADDSVAKFGSRSLRITIDKRRAPVFYFDYFDPIETPIHTALAGHVGWAQVEPRKPYVFSCWIKADQPSVPVSLVAHHSPWSRENKAVEAGPKWRRVEFAFKSRRQTVWCAIGPDLSKSPIEKATLWVDGVQLEAGDAASAYAPRQAVESFIDTPALGNIFTDPTAGQTVRVVAYNAGAAEATVRGRLVVTDFFDNEVLVARPELRLAAGQRGQAELKGLLAGRRGFYRVRWEPAAGAGPVEPLRCAIIDPYRFNKSPFGMNHAYPWAFLLRLAKQAGLTAMRDWSITWQTVEPERGRFDWAKADAQIDRVLKEGLAVPAMFPFPSAPWSSRADLEQVRKAAGKKTHLVYLYTVAHAAKDMADFRRYIEQSVKHYRGRLDCYEIFNEPLFTAYSLPARFGYKMADYLAHLKVAHDVIRAEQPDATILGGIDIWAGHRRTREFIEAGGLQWVDGMTIHQYPYAVPPESYEDDLAETRRLMQARGEAKPIWLTEYGCYADDDPCMTPSTIGNATMSRSRWPSERAASEALVKMAAVYSTWGVAKIFFHAGTSDALNGRSGSGIFFEYGGQPRKMYAALSALANRLGPAPKPLPPRVSDNGLRAYFFDTLPGALAIVWVERGERELRLPQGVAARDIMGNTLAGPRLRVGSTPVYLTSRGHAALRAAIKP